MEIERAIVVMGRLPAPGKVKTRLAAALGEAQAARLYEAFLLDVFDLVERARIGSRAQVFFSVAVSAPEELELAAAMVPGPAWRVFAQQGDTLGEKIEHTRAKTGARHTVIIGSDAPAMPESRLEEAFAALASADWDVVCGPTLDGGYDLIAFAGPFPGLLEAIPWSTNAVMSSTRSAAERIGCRLLALEQGRDVDELADLEALLESLSGAPTYVAPRSRKAATAALPRQKPGDGSPACAGRR